MGIINSSFIPVGSFLQQKIYHVPEYQRGYSWTADQIDDFWIDLTQMHYNDDIENHFLGQIVIHKDKDEKKWYIIDGQQRTSTSIILLDAFRTLFDELDNNYGNQDAEIDANDITSQYIGRLTHHRQTQKLFLSDSDKVMFEKYIQRRDKAEPTKSEIKKMSTSEKLIHEARLYFIKELRSLINDHTDPDKKYSILKKLLDDFLDNFSLMYIETDDINEAFIIFETLNARGKDLETSDLLKNHVLRSANNKLGIVKEQWNLMNENLGNIDPTKFIRHYWNSQYRFIREKDLYKSIRKRVDTPKRVELLIEDLVKLSELYSSLYSPNNNAYYQRTELNERIHDVNKLGARSYYPILLALEKEKFEEEDINNILKNLECLIVRNLVVAGKVANRYEIEFAKIAYEISQHSLTNVGDIIFEIQKSIISDQEFYDDFKIFTTKKTPVVRYFLRKIHNFHNDETRIIDDNNIIHVEHIMPKKINKWDIKDDTHNEYLWKLGNLTLLGQEYNRSATNNTFKKKKEVYIDSKIPMTKALVCFNNWEISDIESRQKSFAKTAIEIWTK